ncbi:small integral membrane protein 29 [Parasteatoda tepidariorum]|uniref:small integral membrane protein 29 n=1 Tax=Parasteatoda tepidariorum TaxID=114398 RepID=UPI001C71A7CF|nr:small integral membrane protein 29 [Parasteatoda tepidariorum]XP_042901973.1 small integral membrane protein 29 [Parasteatoda tepidariorum]
MVSLQNLNVTNFSLSAEDFNVSVTNITLKHENVEPANTFLLDFVILPLTIIVITVIIVGLIAFVIRKKQLDKLRHHLMPLYSFDPAEEGEDWEAELLEEGTDHQLRAKNSRPSEPPQLAFRSNL